MQPLRFGQTLDAIFALMRRIFGPVALLTLLIWIPVAIVSVVAIDQVTNHLDVRVLIDTKNGKYVDYTDEAAFVLIVALVLFLQVITPGVVLVLAQKFAIAKARGEDASLRDSMAIATRKTWPLTVASLLSGVAIVFAFVTIVGGIFLMILWIAVVPLIVDEGVSATRALGRSAELVSGQKRWWATFGRYAFTLLISNVIAGIGLRIALGLDITIVKSDSLGALIVYEACAAFAGAITTVLAVAAVTVIYLELKAREGFVTPLTSEKTFSGFAPPT